MAKRFTDSYKYRKKFIQELPAPYKLLWDYLYHECTFAGIWDVEIEGAQIRIGQDALIEKNKALELFNNGEMRIIELNDGKKWFIRPFIDFQYGELVETNKLHIGVMRELKKEGVSIPLDRVVKGVKDKDKDKDIKGVVKGGNNIPPTIENVIAYCQERKNIVDPHKWHNHYQAKGWFIGKNKMKDWRAAVRTWEKADVHGPGWSGEGGRL